MIGLQCGRFHSTFESHARRMHEANTATIGYKNFLIDTSRQCLVYFLIIVVLQYYALVTKSGVF
jgi:hypothetical protein